MIKLSWSGLVGWLNAKVVYLRMVTHLNANQARCIVTLLNRTLTLPLN